jgi:hypothetical protein
MEQTKVSAMEVLHRHFRGNTGRAGLLAAFICNAAEYRPLTDDEIRTEVVKAFGKEPPPPPPKWASRYMTAEYAENVQPPTFLIDGFLPKGSITMLAGAVAQRKSIVAINIIHALLTGEQLFGHFDITERPSRVIYLCPEMGAGQTVKRLKSLGLLECIGKSLFLQTMDQDSTPIDDLSPDELSDAVVVLDTITRFIDGDENKVEDMRAFAKKVFRLKRDGATTLLLHHNKKGGSDSLDAMRGSSELGAFLDGCWTTTLASLDPRQAYTCDSTMNNVKQRDFESEGFNLVPLPGEYRLAYRISPKSPSGQELATRKADEIVLRMVTEKPDIGINKLQAALKDAKIGHSSPEFVKACKARVLGRVGPTVSSD